MPLSTKHLTVPHLKFSIVVWNPKLAMGLVNFSRHQKHLEMLILLHKEPSERFVLLLFVYILDFHSKYVCRIQIDLSGKKIDIEDSSHIKEILKVKTCVKGYSD